MSCCGGNCGCGSDCKCGSNCGGCKMNVDLNYLESASPTVILISGVASQKIYIMPLEMGIAVENDGCNGGSDDKCYSYN